MLSGSTQESEATRTGSLHFRKGQTGYNHRAGYADPWSTNLASYLLDALPASGIAEDKRDCWESKLPGFFAFCERMWCGTWLWPDLVSLVSISKAFSIPETAGGGWLVVRLWVRKVVRSCSRPTAVCLRKTAGLGLVPFTATFVWPGIPKAVAHD